MIGALLLLTATYTRALERVATLDPAFAQSAYDSRALQLVYETPLAIDYRARPYRLVPGACELPEVSADGLTYVFRLRTAALSAADMIRSLERLRDPELATPNGWMLAAVDTMRARDDRTVEIRLKRRHHVFPWLLAMTPSALVRPDGEGTGPYRLAHWRKNHEMVFASRRPVADGRFDTVRYCVVDDVSTQWLMFLKGELDFLGEISRDNWDAVIGPDGKLDPALAARGIALHSIAALDIAYIGFNMNDPVVGGNAKLRQALSCAFDTPAWCAFYSGRALPATGPVPPGVAGRVTEPLPYGFDIARARKLLAEAGYPDGIDPTTGRRLVLTLAMGRASQDSRESGELIASFFEKIGVRLEAKFYTWDAYLKAVNESRVQLFRMGWVGDYPDAENFLQLFHSKNVSPGPNHAHYVNPAYDRAYEAAMAAADEATRCAHWKTCQEILREDCPWIFTHYTRSDSLVHARVGNYVPSAFPSGNEQYLFENSKKRP